MNNLNNLSNNNDVASSILGPSTTSFTKSSVIETGTSESIFDSIKNISITTWLVIILILAFLGFNIFIYLAKGTQDFTGFFEPIIEKIGKIFAGITGQITSVSAEGAKAVVSGTADVVDTSLTAVQQVSTGETVQVNPQVNPKTSSTSVNSQSVQSTIPPIDIMRENTLNKALNTSEQSKTSTSEYQADDASSTIQSGPPKSGWCFIGEDRGFRTCGQVGVNDTCMSGEIFPSQDICINPTLRA